MLKERIKYICIDGSFLKEDEKPFGLKNRAYRYGDGLFETMHVSGTKVQFYKDHFKRISAGMKMLKMTAPILFNEESIEGLISKLLNKNKYLKGAKVRLGVFRKDGGLYTPTNNEVSFVIESEPLSEYLYTLNEKGLKLGVYKDILKPINSFSQIKSSNALLFVLAGIHCKENYFDDCLVLNSESRVSEAISSNLFMVKGDQIFTPSISEGCLPGIMRNKVIMIAERLNFKVDADCSLMTEDLMFADEIFLTNAVKGIQWVGAYKQRRYFNNTAKLLTNKLNELYIPD